jgi:predicted MFS family arabinose efflux permease
MSAAAVVWLSMLGALVVNIQPMFLGAISEVYGFDAAQLGFISGAELGGGCIASLLALYWFPRLNLSKLISVALVVSVVGNLVTPMATTYTSLLIVRFCTALFGTGVLYAIILGVIGQMQNPEKLFASAIILQVVSVAVFMLLTPELISEGSMTGVTLLMAALMASGFYAKNYLVIVSHKASDHAASKSLGLLLWGLPGLALLGLVAFDVGISSIWAFVERLGGEAGLSMDDSGLALAAGSGIGVLGAFFAAYLGMRWGRLKPFTASILGLLIACLMFMEASTWFSYMLAVGLLNLFWNFALPYLLGSIALFDKTGRLMVLIPAAQSAGFAIGPMVAGLFIVGADYRVSALVAFVAFVCCAAIVLPMLLKMKNSPVGQK